MLMELNWVTIPLSSGMLATSPMSGQATRALK